MENGTGDSPLAAAAREAAARIRSITIDPREMVVHALAQIGGGQSYPPERHAAALVLVRDFANEAAELIRQNSIDALHLRIHRAVREARLLTMPVPKPPFSEHLKSMADAMQRASWTSLELDLLLRFGAEYDSVIGFDEHGATLASGRHVSRKMLRESLRPAWQSETDFHNFNAEYQWLARAEPQ
jgi:hypothetical protein